jgi:hypothetical protein
MRTDPQIASRFESCAVLTWTGNVDLRSFIAGFFNSWIGAFFAMHIGWFA